MHGTPYIFHARLFIALNGRFGKFSRRDFLKMALIGGATLAIPLLAREIGRTEPEQPYVKNISAMGTTVSIRIEDHVEPVLADLAAGRAIGEINRLAEVLTRFPGGTQVCGLNQTGELEAPGADVVGVLHQAERFSESTGGSFDVTVKPVLDLLDGYLSGQPFPSDSQFEVAKSLIDYGGVSTSDHFVSFAKPGMSVTLDGIAEGYILDRAASALKESGIRSALVNVGGSIRAVGSRADGSPWAIGIVNPVEPESILGTLRLRDQAVATSGDYENYYTTVRSYYHIIDPRTARSPLYSHSATVVAPTAVEADRMGVVLMVEDPSVGPRIADALGCEYLICTRAGGDISSAGMEELMK